jgi:hypothetical protein
MGRLAIPKGLRPGILGLLLVRRVIMGDIAATIIDLAGQGFVAVDETDSGWSVRVVPTRTPLKRQQGLLAYERQLLAELPLPAGGQPLPALPALAATLGPGLNRVRTEIVKEAVHQGWVHRWSHDQLTDGGRQFVTQVSTFERRLRELSRDGAAGELSGALLPYALRFQLVSRDQIPLAAFAADWADAFTDLPGWRPPGYKRPEREDLRDTPQPHIHLA